MGSDYHVQIVLLQETLDPVRTEFHNVTSLRRVAQVVGVNTQLAVGVRGVRPEDVQDYLRFLVLHLMHHFQRSFDVLYIFESVE